MWRNWSGGVFLHGQERRTHDASYLCSFGLKGRVVPLWDIKSQQSHLPAVS